MPVYPGVGVYVTPAGLTLVSEGAVAGRPPIVPWDGAELTVHVSVSPVPSVIVSIELIEEVVFEQRPSVCAGPLL